MGRIGQRSGAASAAVAVGATAATARDKKKRYDNEPDPLVLKQIAKAVHIVSSVNKLRAFRSTLSYYGEAWSFVTEKSREKFEFAIEKFAEI